MVDPAPAQKPDAPFCAAYRLTLDAAKPFRLHIAAAEHYVFFANGPCDRHGAERGHAGHMFFDTYEVEAAGPLTLVFQVWGMSPHAPWRRISTGHGLLVADGSTPASRRGNANG